jgi:hypothetical protein
MNQNWRPALNRKLGPKNLDLGTTVPPRYQFRRQLLLSSMRKSPCLALEGSVEDLK